jgi:hypothetical protein
MKRRLPEQNTATNKKKKKPFPVRAPIVGALLLLFAAVIGSLAWTRFREPVITESPATLPTTGQSSVTSEPTTEPQISVVLLEVTIEVGSELPEAKEFFLEPPIAVGYVTDLAGLDVDQPGEHSIELRADGRLYTGKLQVVDTTPPVITGSDLTIVAGETVSYRKHITVEDNCDGPVRLEIDNSQVIVNVPGEYPVIFSATDTAGNSSSLTLQVTVLKPDPRQEAVLAMTDEVLGRIINEQMSKRDKAWAIFKWTNRSITYTGSADDSSVLAGAYEGFKFRRGNCFTYYALSEVLLTRAGIDNMRITRIGGNTDHYWNLVNCGDGWYHFDASERRAGDTFVPFMKTDAEMEEYTIKTAAAFPDKINYYTFDPSLYPERGQ